MDTRYADDVAEWSRLHGGYDASRSRLVSTWVVGCLRLARPLVRWRVDPLAVTLTALPIAAGACALAAGGRADRAVAVVLVVAAAVVDGIDGALAVLSRRVTRMGFVADSVTDRVVDGLFVVALWCAGASAWAAVVAGAGLVLFEYTRARAGAAGMSEIGVVTVGERPTRVILVAVALLATVVMPRDAGSWATAGAVATAVVAVVGLVQFVMVARHSLLR